MPKRVAVIDIGSNSARLVIYQRTSRYGFHLIAQQKSRVRIGEGAYEKGGRLQSEGMRRAYGALQSFSHTIREYKVHKVHCVATSALRDAPNRGEFTSMVRRKLGIRIRVIDGTKEAFYGAVAAANLLPIRNAITVDIGGGSADLALIRAGRIEETFSLKLGTVRIKELFTDRDRNLDEARSFVRKELSKLPESFHGPLVVGIGGTARALSRGIILQNRYPFEKIHAFEYSVPKERHYLERVIHASPQELPTLSIKKNRLDTIREGTLIFEEILRHLGAKQVLSSGVGVREGVFLQDLLRNDKFHFPPGINPSIRSIKDRFDLLRLPEGNKERIGQHLFLALLEHFDGSPKHLRLLLQALSLSNIGKMLTIYKEHQHAFYIASQELNYGFTHQQMLTIALLLRSKGDSLYYRPLYRRYKELLPSKKKIKWLSFIYTLTLILHENSSRAEIDFAFDGKSLRIFSDRPLYLAHESIAHLEKPAAFHIELHDNCESIYGSSLPN